MYLVGLGVWCPIWYAVVGGGLFSIGPMLVCRVSLVGVSYMLCFLGVADLGCRIDLG
jgi:hypothetical protein